MRLHSIDQAVCAFWVFVWQPIFFFVVTPYLWSSFSPIAATLLMTYGAFTPALVWIFIAEPYLQRREARKKQQTNP